MASTYYKLETQKRVKVKAKGSKELRREGFIPGVLYYAGEDNVNISINKSDLFHAMQSGQRIFEIDQNGDQQYTMIKEIQYHPVTDEIIHIDLMRVRRSEKMTISVPLVLIGEAIGVKTGGGILTQSLNQIEINCFPTDVPEQLELNIEELDLNQAKNIGDIEITNDDIEIVSDLSLNVVSITPPAAEEELETLDSDEELDSEVDSSPESDEEKESSDNDSSDKS